MTASRGSILQKLQWGFALGALLLAALMGALMDHALRTSLEAEDAQAMEFQARAMLRRLHGGGAPADPAELALSRAEWRLIDVRGRILAESAGMARLSILSLPHPGQPPQERFGADGRPYAVLVRSPEGGSGRLVLVMDRSHEAGVVSAFRQTLAVVIGAAGLAAAMMGRLVAGWGLAPLRLIVRETQAIDDRSLDRRLEPENFPAELQDLVTTLNAALARLQGAFARLEHLGAELAHELRTPLQGLRSTLENLAVAPPAPQALPGALGTLLEECDRMASLVEQILFLARRDALDDADLPRLFVPELLEEARAFFEAAGEEAGVALVVEAPLGMTIQADRILMLRALHNLLANALRHAPRGSRILLRAEARGGEVALCVEDAGPGFPKAVEAELGRPFLRGPGSRSGLGLGLALVARIATLHGGRLEVGSGPAGGAVASLTIPVA